jgi:hypothetical protein
MNLPISWVAAAALPASQAVRQTANVAVKSASHFFGSLVQGEATTRDSGQSETIGTSKRPANSGPKSWTERVDAIRTQLARFVSDARAKYGDSSSRSAAGSLAVEASGPDAPLQVIGPEPIRTELQQHLLERTELSDEIKSLAATQSAEEPLRWLPNQDKSQGAASAFRIWLDSATN